MRTKLTKEAKYKKRDTCYKTKVFRLLPCATAQCVTPGFVRQKLAQEIKKSFKVNLCWSDEDDDDNLTIG